MKLLQTVCGLFGHKWVTYTKGQMCKHCGKKRNMDKWYYETNPKVKEKVNEIESNLKLKYPNLKEKGGEG